MEGVILTMAVVAASWLAGTIPSAYIVTKLAAGKDIRAVGSGNPGATNVFRTLGAKFAVPVFAFDFLKGFAPAFAALHGGMALAVSPLPAALLAGSAAIAGHLASPWTGWKGGKGVATGAGVVTALYPLLAPACLGVFVPVLLISRRMSPASISAAVSVPVWYFAIEAARGNQVNWVLFSFFALVPLVVVARHRRNIRRLREGTEERLF
jgi:glycerol-3-phosphate acyltransferase PlsY